MYALEVKNLNKSFGSRKIISDLSFNVSEGEVLGFLGPNGCGKTTTIKMIMGFLRPDSGTIIINGTDVKKDYEKAMSSIGGIVENPEMYNYLSGRKNIEMYMRIHDGISPSRIDEVLNLVGMANHADEKVKKYSLGMKQRIGLALALVHEPKLLILDEPTNGLDPDGIKGLRNILKYLAHEKNCAVMVSSHLLAEMELMCDRVLIISNGQVIGEKTISELDETADNMQRYFFGTTELSQAFVLLSKYADRNLRGENGGISLELRKEEVPEIVQILATGGVPITAVNQIHTSLEDEFMNITKGGSNNA